MAIEIEQLDFGFKTPPRKRKKRIGRPPIRDRRASERHKTREALPAKTPVLVTMRAEKSVGQLRRRKIYQAIRKAMMQAFAKAKIRIVHLSIQRDHMHAIVEANGRSDLARGIQGFQVSAARHINRACGRDGRVFADRYHADQLRKPKMVRNAISYVLNNWRKHGEDRGSIMSIDPYASAVNFAHWKVNPPVVPLDEPLVVSEATFWLLAVGWTRHGLIDPDEVPGTKLNART